MIPLQTCKSAEWDSPHDGFRLFWIWPRDLTHTGQHDSWIYVIGTDTVLAQFDCHRPSDLIHGSFRCAICRMIGYGSLESWKQLIKCKLQHGPVIVILSRPLDLTYPDWCKTCLIFVDFFFKRSLAYHSCTIVLLDMTALSSCMVGGTSCCCDKYYNRYI